MVHGRKLITLVSFAPRPLSDTIVRWLGCRGIEAVVAHGPSWCGLQQADATSKFLLLTDSRSDRTGVERIVAALAGACWTGVHDERGRGAGTASRPGGTVAGCALAWPADKAALAAWIERHVDDARQVDRDQDGDCDQLMAEFMRFNLVGQSPAFLDCLRMIKRAARATAPILLQGATGTGKELAARAIHYLGPRRGTPFIPVNCGAIPDTLVESELFGHEKGSFTGASTARTGLIAQASGGTLFLDEADALSAKTQIVLLRFLQDQSYRPLGAGATRQSDTKIIAASNADLAARVRDGSFREDLMFRLAIITLQLPPLRGRVGDVTLLARHFMLLLSGRYGTPKVLDDAALAALERHNWPGNVRELENVLHRAYVISPHQVLQRADLEFGCPAGSRAESSPPLETELDALPFREAKARAIDAFEQRYLRRLITAADGNVTLAANRAGKERRALGKLLKKHQIAPTHAVGNGTPSVRHS